MLFICGDGCYCRVSLCVVSNQIVQFDLVYDTVIEV